MSFDIRDLFLMFLIFGGGFWVLAPLARAVAKRIGSTAPTAADPRAIDELREDMQQVRHEVGELAERLDFVERALVQQKSSQRLGPPA